MYFLLWGNCHAGRRMCLLFSCQTYGPVHLLHCLRRSRLSNSIYLVSNMKEAHSACSYYRKGCSIETFFDQESRGFHLHKSHLSDPDRLMCLMMAACLVYIRSSTWESSLAMRLDGSPSSIDLIDVTWACFNSDCGCCLIFSMKDAPILVGFFLASWQTM